MATTGRAEDLTDMTRFTSVNIGFLPCRQTVPILANVDKSRSYVLLMDQIIFQQ